MGTESQLSPTFGRCEECMMYDGLHGVACSQFVECGVAPFDFKACALQKGHDGPHQSRSGRTWEQQPDLVAELAKSLEKGLKRD